MPYSIVIHHTYNSVIIALSEKDVIIAQSTIGSKNICKLCMPTINELLSEKNLSLDTIDFIAVNTGPGPFSTLRSIIASVNGLHLATKIPLISIDGLSSLHHEYSYHSKTPVVALLNAYSDDVYFYFKHNGYHESGYANSDKLLKHLTDIYKDQNVMFIGNGSTLHAEKITAVFGSRACIEHDKEHASIISVVKYAYARWEIKDYSLYLSAQYIKTYQSGM